MKSKQLLLIEKCICLTIPFVNSVHKFFEMYLSYSLNFTTNIEQLFQQNGFSRVSVRASGFRRKQSLF